MDISDMIIELCSMAGPAGFESPVASRVKEMLEPYVSEAYIDVMGNVIGVRRCGRENAVKLLFDAHIDEIGFIITGVEEGFLRFQALGGVDAHLLPASELKVLTEPPLYGVIAAMPPHVLKAEDSDKAIKIDDLYLDLGMTQEEAEQIVPVGTPAVYNAGVYKMGEDLVCGKALDDRACVAVILRAMELLKEENLGVDLYVMASAQEEVGRRGAKTGVFAIVPDYCVVVDVGFAKTPDCKAYNAKEQGGGAVITRGPNMNRRFTDMAVNIAEKNDIKYQINVEPTGDSGTNAYAIQVAREGVATAMFELPLKYMHSPVEMASLVDAEAVARLLKEVALSLGSVNGEVL